MSWTPKLGFILPKYRTPAQEAAHARAMATIPQFRLTGQSRRVAVGQKVMLTDFWKRPEVIADVGAEFTGFHQLTGSCVGASEGNAIFTLGAVQRTIAVNPTKAFVPWWLFPYGRTRYNEGDRGQGEGAVDSVMGETLAKEGVFDANQQGLAKFSTDDGWYLTESLEMQWSDGAKIAQPWKDLAAPNTLGSHATCSSVDDIRDAIVNGYPVLDGASMYIGHGSIKGSGDTAYVVGHYDGSGGHSTCWLGYWEHPNDGPLYSYSNQWPTSTYPKDPAGLGRCCVWAPESEAKKLFTRLGGNNGETMALSHLKYVFPAQPSIVDYYS